MAAMFNEEQMKAMKEMEEAKTELEDLKSQVDDSIKELKSVAKESAASLIVRCVVAACTSKAVDTLTRTFLPSSARGVVKAGASLGAFFIPELIGNMAAGKVEKILREE